MYIYIVTVNLLVCAPGGKTIRFNLNSSFNGVVLSHNAQCVMEACYIPAITGINNYILFRLVTPKNDKA